MICKKCGENLPDNARECFTCGAKVKREAPVVTADGEVVKPSKVKKTAGELFKEMFCGYDFMIITAMVLICGVISVISGVSEFFSYDWSEIKGGAVGIIFAKMCMLIAAGLKVFAAVWLSIAVVKAYKTSSNNARDYIKPFDMFRIYTIIRMVALVVETGWTIVLATLLTAVADGVFSSIAGGILTMVILLFPYIIANKFTTSLVRSAKLDRVEIQNASTMKNLTIVFGVIIVLFGLVVGIIVTIIILLSSSGAELFSSIASILSSVATVALLFKTHNWFKSMTEKIEWMK